MPKIGIFVRFGLAHMVPCWWIGLGLWRAGCVSQDMALYKKLAHSDNECVKAVVKILEFLKAEKVNPKPYVILLREV